LATVEDARGIAGIAVADAEGRLLERGVDLHGCGGLLEALRHGTEQVIAAREHGRDTADYRRFVDEVYARLDADPIDDTVPEPPKRSLAMRW
jgi:hypothetical protein